MAFAYFDLKVRVRVNSDMVQGEPEEVFLARMAKAAMQAMSSKEIPSVDSEGKLASVFIIGEHVLNMGPPSGWWNQRGRSCDRDADPIRENEYGNMEWKP